MSEDLTQDLEASYRALRGEGGVAPVQRDLVRVEGVDAEGFLQGQLSQDVTGLDHEPAGTASRWSFLLQPAGKVDAWLRVSRFGDGMFVLDVDGGFGEAVVRRLERFKLRTKAEIGLMGQTMNVCLTAMDTSDPDRGKILLPAMCGASDELPNRPLVSFDAYEAVRIECGVPKMGAELTENTIPAEAGQWLIDTSVSFTKGCYTGQELVARIDSRGGNVPKHLRGVIVDGDVPLVGAAVLVDDAEVGRLTSVGRSPEHGPVALAYIARKVEAPAAAIVRWDGAEAPARIELLPLI